MASHLDDLDHQHLVELHRKVDLLVKMVARQQSEVNRLTKRSDARAAGRGYLRSTIRKKREEIAQQKLYIIQLENELRLRGLE